jgi:hypothetical protein
LARLCVLEWVASWRPLAGALEAIQTPRIWFGARLTTSSYRQEGSGGAAQKVVAKLAASRVKEIKAKPGDGDLASDDETRQPFSLG